MLCCSLDRSCYGALGCFTLSIHGVYSNDGDREIKFGYGDWMSCDDGWRLPNFRDKDHALLPSSQTMLWFVEC